MKLVVVVFSFSLFGQNWVEVQTYSHHQSADVRLDGLFTKAIKDRWGGFAWFQAEQKYSQVYAGATYRPKPWLQLALGAGVEQDRNPFRVGSYAYFGKGRVSSLAVFETGGSGFWYKVETNYQTKFGLGVGTYSNLHKGHGPKLEYQLPKTRATLWSAPLSKKGRLGVLVGVRWKL